MRRTGARRVLRVRGVDHGTRALQEVEEECMHLLAR